jgi:hypothetical protein
MGSPQGLAKYQSRRISAPSPMSGQSQSTGLFNQVPSLEEAETLQEAPPPHSNGNEGSSSELPRRVILRQPVSAKQAAKLDNRMLELATRYVEIFQEQTPAKMSSAEKSALILEIAVFYSHPSRLGRLENLVTALDNAPH